MKHGLVALLAYCIMSKDWERLHTTLMGLDSHEEKIEAVVAACQAIGEVRVSYLILDAVEKLK